MIENRRLFQFCVKGRVLLFRILMFISVFAANPATASTYYFSYEFDSSSYGYRDSRDLEGTSISYDDGPMRVSGYVETDGSTGILDNSNFLSWEITLETANHFETFGGEFDDLYSRVSGEFEVTNSTIIALTGYTEFFMYDYAPNPDGTQRENRWYLRWYEDTLTARANYYTFPTYNVRENLQASEYEPGPLTFHRGPPTVVSLPSSIALLFASLGMLGFLRCRVGRSAKTNRLLASYRERFLPN